MLGTWVVLLDWFGDVDGLELDAFAKLEDRDALASKLEMMSTPDLVAWLVLTLYRPNFKRVRRSSARDFFAGTVGGDVGIVVGAEVGGGSTWVAASLFWLAHSS